ncbi:GMC family oxidoreductase [Mesorhizobium sp. CO1-1-7]|uniref:GMC family oxidoreductase n=1 Tax=unclassified Mesorhizobium TaxID=325217 RepID=UPI00112CCAA5|nr:MULTISPECIES: GMC family oxidoreductase [unclassified Mesorhizobium]MBZ9726773.1 GMC family oxidoreductase [Mesorhizobium sp. CO1-1-11]MBZ9747541.1 GMC family oxidoreductase [Mesorhizobium sp. CO1-1-7]MBZ9756168.1 GMC family oxidoreductase [Mesorhizobium sp. ESP6-5]TPK11181.1 GMC family oxidoreductase [Mesorhizobium sp. B2-5-9]TPK84077.1 GMC family oxidoreductase [Mesorhizobium sp. B2-4-13]
MTTILPRKDVVIVGLGWTGSILAHELTDQGLDVLAIERGPWRDTATDFNIGYAQDELRYSVRRDLFLQPAVETMTMRNDPSQTALPMRDFGSFLPGNGVGGAGVHWNGHTWRFWDSDFQIKTNLTKKYGAARIADLQVEDWGVTGAEMEPYYDQFEYLAGISGKAGNIKGQIQEGGNPFEDPRSRDYPNPPMEMTYAPTLFANAGRSMGLHPFPTPSANMSRPYVNPLGITMGQCTYCGFCERFGCANYSKSSAQTTILPVLMKKANFEVRTDSEVLHVDLAAGGKSARGVTYVDTSGQEFFQPADLVLLCAYGLHNARLMMLSGIGKIYDPATGEGTVGRNYCYQTNAGVQVFFDDKNFNPFIAAGALGQTIDDYNGDAFDHGGLDFVGGAGINCIPTNGRPIGTRPTLPGTPKWGSAWKKATVAGYKSTLGFSSQGSSYATRTNYLDLDPTYKDRFGRPLMRMTFDFPDNDIRMSNYLCDRMEEIAKTLGGKQYNVGRRKKGWDSVPYQSTHNTGGAIMGTDPRKSAVNSFLQSWDVPNVFVIGASAFPQNAGKNPTGTVGALAYRAADGIRNHYLRNPGAPLVQA